MTVNKYQNEAKNKYQSEAENNYQNEAAQVLRNIFKMCILIRLIGFTKYL